jgi:hypothetical protein
MNNDSDASVTTPNSGLTLTYSAAATATLTGATNALTRTVTSGGKSSDYTFTFTPSGTVESTDQCWIKFPRDYAEIVATRHWPSDGRFKRYGTANPHHSFLTCAGSDNLGSNVECTVDHRTVRVSNVAAVNSSQ